jgi:hypothetical protein
MAKFKVLFQYLSGEIEGNYEKPVSIAGLIWTQDFQDTNQLDSGQICVVQTSYESLFRPVILNVNVI